MGISEIQILHVLLTYMYYVLCDVVRYVASCLLSAATKETFRRQMLCLKVRRGVLTKLSCYIGIYNY